MNCIVGQGSGLDIGIQEIERESDDGDQKRDRRRRPTGEEKPERVYDSAVDVVEKVEREGEDRERVGPELAEREEEGGEPQSGAFHKEPGEWGREGGPPSGPEMLAVGGREELERKEG